MRLKTDYNGILEIVALKDFPVTKIVSRGGIDYYKYSGREFVECLDQHKNKYVIAFETHEDISNFMRSMLEIGYFDATGYTRREAILGGIVYSKVKV